MCRLLQRKGKAGRAVLTLPGKNHMLLEQDPGTPIFLEETRNFLR
jgi:hypothetical protein